MLQLIYTRCCSSLTAKCWFDLNHSQQPLRKTYPPNNSLKIRDKFLNNGAAISLPHIYSLPPLQTLYELSKPTKIT